MNDNQINKLKWTIIVLSFLGFLITTSFSQESFYKGITFGGMFWPEGNLQFVDENLDYMSQFGFNTITLIPNWYVDDYNDPTIEPWYRDKPGFPNTQWFSPTLYDSEISDIINSAKSKGYKIILKPHVDPLNSPFGGVGRWGLQKDTGNWDELFASYTDFILYHAQLAEELKVSVLVIGCELESMTHDWSGVTNADQRWREIISKVRNVYSGKITYSCSFHGGRDDTWSSPNNISFWDALDYIGFELYRGLTSNKRNPSLTELKEGAEDVFQNYMKPLAEQYNKKILIPETNFYSFDGVNTNPLSDPAVSDFLVENSSPDPQEQADCYQAILEVLYKKYGEEYFKGIIWWAGYLIDTDNIDVNAENKWAFEDKYDWIWFKPVEDILKEYWFNSTTNILDHNIIPTTFSLYQNYPNPFNPSTTIKFGLPVQNKVRLVIYNMLGQKVATLLNEEMDAGYHSVEWDASGTSSGIYFYKISTGEFVQTNKMILMK